MPQTYIEHCARVIKVWMIDGSSHLIWLFALFFILQLVTEPVIAAIFAATALIVREQVETQRILKHIRYNLMTENNNR